MQPTKLSTEQFLYNVRTYLAQHVDMLRDAGFAPQAAELQTKIAYIQTIPQAMRLLTTMGDTDDAFVYLLRCVVETPQPITHNDAMGNNEPHFDAQYQGAMP